MTYKLTYEPRVYNHTTDTIHVIRSGRLLGQCVKPGWMGGEWMFECAGECLSVDELNEIAHYIQVEL